MFGMSSDEFWEQDPKLYWAYRTFYLKQKEFENNEKQEYIKYEAWLNGNITYIATSTALNNAFSKQKREFPSYDKMFTKEGKKQKTKTKNEINKQVQEEFNAWARF
jgi:hypothetical protein